MTDVDENNKQQAVTSEELIAEAYAAIKLSERNYDLPQPTGAPVMVQNTAEASARSATSEVAGGSKNLSSTKYSDARRQEGQAFFPPPKTKPLLASYKQPPPPSGSPATMTKPIRASKQTVSTSSGSSQADIPYSQGPLDSPGPFSSPGPSRPQSSSRPQGSTRTQGGPRPAKTPPPTKQKSSGMGTLIMWSLIILFILWVLPNIHIFD